MAILGHVNSDKVQKVFYPTIDLSNKLGYLLEMQQQENPKESLSNMIIMILEAWIQENYPHLYKTKTTSSSQPSSSSVELPSEQIESSIPQEQELPDQHPMPQ